MQRLNVVIGNYVHGYIERPRASTLAEMVIHVRVMLTYIRFSANSLGIRD